MAGETMDMNEFHMRQSERVRAVETELEDRVRYRELMERHNELTRDIFAKIESQNTEQRAYIKDLIDRKDTDQQAREAAKEKAQKIAFEAREASRDQSQRSAIQDAVNLAMKERDEQEDRARLQLEKKQADALAGAKGQLMGQGGAIVLLVVVVGFFAAKALGIDL